MSEFPKPNVVISRCLGFEACRYNGEIIEDNFAARLGEHVRFITVCPEVGIGMGTPRPPVRLVSSAGELRMIQPSTGEDFTEAMRRFSAKFLDSVEEIDGFLLTHRSPSCGIGDAKFYNTVDKGPSLGKTSGLFAEAVLRKFPNAAVEDDARLLNLRIREHFLIRLFAFARLRQLRERPSARGLVEFHAAHKLLLLSYSERAMRRLGRIVANPEKDRAPLVIGRYTGEFHTALRDVPKAGPQINVLLHAFGHFSEGLTAREKRHFLATLESYRKGRVPLYSVGNVLWSWALRFETTYILQQVFFRPFPEGLLDTGDSGKGRASKPKSAR